MKSVAFNHFVHDATDMNLEGIDQRGRALASGGVQWQIRQNAKRFVGQAHIQHVYLVRFGHFTQLGETRVAFPLHAPQLEIFVLVHGQIKLGRQACVDANLRHGRWQFSFLRVYSLRHVTFPDGTLV